MTADMDARLAIDTAVLLLYFVVIIWIGLYMGRKEDNLKDFALAVRQFRGGPCSLRSSRRKLAPPPFRYAGRRLPRSQLHYICNWPLGTILARILVSYIFIKPYYDYKVYSIYEYLTARFGVPRKTRHPLFSWLRACWRPVRACM